MHQNSLSTHLALKATMSQTSITFKCEDTLSESGNCTAADCSSLEPASLGHLRKCTFGTWTLASFLQAQRLLLGK